MVGPGFLDLPSRTVKPRGTGITHVLDRGLPLGYCADLLESGGASVDVWKFGWGISYLDPHLAAKLELLARLPRGHPAGDRLGAGPGRRVLRLGPRRRVPVRRGVGGNRVHDVSPEAGPHR